jgi:hypothetical protein
VRVPQKMVITIKIGGQQTAGMLVMLKFLTVRKNPYNLVFGPSDEKGRVVVTREQVIAEARKSMELFLMDYGEIEAEWTGKLQVTPMNRESIGRALSALRLFRRVHEYLPAYEESLGAADALLAQKGEADLTATVQCETEKPIAIETVPVRST